MSSSNPFTISRIAAPTNPLAAAAAALSPGQWGSIETLGFTSSLIDGAPQSDSLMSWGIKAYWDAPRGRLLFFGMPHHSSGLNQSRIIRYVAATNTWSVENDNVAADPNYTGGGTHGYDHFAYRPSDGMFFIKRSKTGRIFRREATNTTNNWIELATIPGVQFWDFGTADSLHFHPGLNGGAGGLVHIGPAAIYISNAAVSSWTLLRSAGGTSGELEMLSINNPLDGNNVYTGGGGGFTGMWRIAANGTLSQLVNAPVAYSNAPNGSGLFRSTGTNRPFIIRSNGAINEYNHLTNTWSGTISTRPFTPSPYYFGGPIDELGVCVFMRSTSSNTPSPTMHIWKR